MSVLTLTTTIIAPIADLSDTLLINQYGETENVSDLTTVRVYAGGIRRVVTVPGRTQTYLMSYRRMSRANYDGLLDLVSVPVLFRDQRARAVYGVIGSLTGQESAQTDLMQNVSFTVQNITYSEIL
jgi:hypothetical protein